ncbi:hypothetical protein V1264_021423 [Littorina saxatilis]|uniref:Uncharacterized protein n=1 Tax=Littorina saxatilis TaxID=31220 RepID=A0AAN9AIC6_9CAEN
MSRARYCTSSRKLFRRKHQCWQRRAAQQILALDIAPTLKPQVLQTQVPFSLQTPAPQASVSTEVQSATHGMGLSNA